MPEVIDVPHVYSREELTGLECEACMRTRFKRDGDQSIKLSDILAVPDIVRQFKETSRAYRPCNHRLSVPYERLS